MPMAEMNVNLAAPFQKLGQAVPKKYLKHRILLIVLFAVFVFAYVFVFMPRTTFQETAVGTKQSAGELTAGMSVSQKITVHSGTLKSLLIDFDTFYRRNVAEYTVEVFRADGSPVLETNGQPMVRVFNADKLVEGSSFGVSLPPQQVADGDEFVVKISTDDAQAGHALGLLMHVDKEGTGQPAVVTENGAEQTLKGSLSMQAGYESFSKNAIILAAILVIAVALAILFWSNKLHVNVLILILIFGVLFSLITPIWDTPDEGQHTASAFLLADGQLSAGGGDILQSYDSLKENYTGTLVNNTLSDVQQGNVHEYTSWGGGKFFLGFLPQAVGLWLGKLLQLNMAGYFYIGRIFNVLAYAVLAFFAVKYAKKFKLFFAVLALMPMSLVLAGSYNPDAVTYGLALMLGAYFTNLYFNQAYKIGWRHMLVFMLLAALLIMNKYTLALLAALPLFIPISRFENKKTKWLLGLAVVAVCAIGAMGIVLWQTAGAGGTSALSGTNVNDQGASRVLQTQWILQNPGAAFSVYSKTIVGQMGDQLLQLFNIGQLSYSVFNIFSLIYFGFLALVALAYTRYEYRPERIAGNVAVPLWSRALLLLAILGTVLLTYVALHLMWTPVGADTILGVQGRYFIPLFVLLPFIGQNAWPLVGRETYERGRLNIQFVAVLIAAVTLLTTLLKYY